jgi:hypothetical protein
VAKLIHEDEAASLPRLTSPQALFQLALVVGLQFGHEVGV